MSPTLMLAFLRQRLTSPMRLVLLVIVFLTSVGMNSITGSFGGAEGNALFYAIVLAAGAIGQDVSSGVLQLMFARPVTRPCYVFSRWFAAGAGGGALLIVQMVLACGLLLARGLRPDLGELLPVALAGIVLAFTASAVIVMLSSLASGLGDLALYFLATLVLTGTGQVARWKGWSVVERLADELGHVLAPQLHLGWLAGRGAPSWFELVSVLSTLTFSLAVAVLVVNRKELSYAAG